MYDAKLTIHCLQARDIDEWGRSARQFKIPDEYLEDYNDKNWELSRDMTKPTKWHVRPAKTQISLGIRPVWSESSLCAQWIAKDPGFLHADSGDSDQTGRMPRLIWVFAERTAILLVLSCRGSYRISHNCIFHALGLGFSVTYQVHVHLKVAVSEIQSRLYYLLFE